MPQYTYLSHSSQRIEDKRTNPSVISDCGQTSFALLELMNRSSRPVLMSCYGAFKLDVSSVSFSSLLHCRNASDISKGDPSEFGNRERPSHHLRRNSRP